MRNMAKLTQETPLSQWFRFVTCLMEDFEVGRTVGFKMEILCNPSTRHGLFRSQAEEVGKMLSAALRESCNDAAEDIALVPVMTAAAWIVNGVLDKIPMAQVCYVGMERVRVDGKFMPNVYKSNLVGKPAKHAVIVEPMLATGGSAVEAIRMAKEWGSPRITVVSVLAAPDGLNAINKAHPEAKIIVAQIAGGLDSNAYIINPRIGDFGDRCAGIVRPH